VLTVMCIEGSRGGKWPVASAVRRGIKIGMHVGILSVLAAGIERAKG